MGDERYNIRAVERTMDILNCFSGEREELSLSEISTQIDLPRSSTHRFLVTLENGGFLEVNPLNHYYHLGSKILNLGSLAIGRIRLADKGYSHLVQLSKTTQATAHIVVMNQGEAMYIAKVEDSNSIIRSYVGKRVPLHSSAVGKVILGAMSEEQFDSIYKDKELQVFTQNTIKNVNVLKACVGEVLQNGYALDNEELEEGLRCVAAPIKNYEGKTIAALSVSSLAPKLSSGRLPEIISQVQKTAFEISRDIGFLGD